MDVLTKTLITKSEEDAVKSGAFSFEELMLVAGTTAAKIILEKTSCINKRIAVICGNGNNGGDGFVVAKHLYEHGADVTVITPLGEPLSENAIYYYNLLPKDIKITDSVNQNYDIVIDAVFGIGLNRSLSDEINFLFEKVNQLNAIRIAIDIPSGIEADSGKVLGTPFNADFTITFIALKPCFLLPKGSDYIGEVIIADIGVTPTDYTYKTIEKSEFKKRLKNSHKGDFGSALLIVGSYGMAGAAILALKGALRSGLGIAKCVTLKSIYTAVTSSVPEAVCIPIKNLSKLKLNSALEKCSALLFGCGIGQSKRAEKLLKKIIKKSCVPIVLDADGINILSKRIELLKKSKVPVIITPHSGEMARLCGTTAQKIEENRVEYAKNFALNYGCTVVLKGANTVIATKNGEVSINTNGNAGMATGGSGDVLAGIIVSLLAQGFSPESAAEAAVFLHGEAGDKAAAKRGMQSMLPSDIIDEL